MTTDLTPLVTRKRALRRQLVWHTVGMAAAVAAALAAFGTTPEGFVAIMVLVTGFGRGMRQSWQERYRLAREELDDATASLDTRRAILRASVDRRDAARGLALSDETAGGDLAIGQEGELSKDR
jgi:hypothetical protein